MSNNKNFRSSSISISTKRQRRENPQSWLENETLEFVAGSSDNAVVRTNVASQHDKELFMDRLQKEIIPYYWKTKEKTIGTEGKGNKDTTGSNEKQSTEISVTATENTSVVIHQQQQQQRLIMGTNQCTRVLENTLQGLAANNNSINNNSQGNAPVHVEPVVLPSLIVLARDIYPPTILSHIPVMAEQIRRREKESGADNNYSNSSLPILLLPGPASHELGKIFGTKRVSVLMFLPPSSTTTATDDEVTLDGSSTTKQDDDDKMTSFLQFVTKTIKLHEII